MTRFENCVVNSVDRGGELLRAAALWRPDLTGADEAAVRVLADEHNRSQFIPRAAVVTTSGSGHKLCVDMTAVSAAGPSDAQLEAFLEISANMIVSAFDALRDTLGVTTTDDNGQ